MKASSIGCFREVNGETVMKSRPMGEIRFDEFMSSRNARLDVNSHRSRSKDRDRTGTGTGTDTGTGTGTGSGCSILGYGLDPGISLAAATIAFGAAGGALVGSAMGAAPLLYSSQPNIQGTGRPSSGQTSGGLPGCSFAGQCRGGAD